ncbi:MAG: hypothetical protein K6T59_14255, partial [Bryobacteraceae bacterium]|nr:hypothetical protein [Bryobacteraceae bacterium]
MLLAFALPVWCEQSANTESRAAERQRAPQKIVVKWQNALIEEALLKTTAAAAGEFAFLCDSYDGDVKRFDGPDEAATL